MITPSVNSRVRLVQDVPEYALQRGEIGVVRSQWCAPETAYEVEFQHPGVDAATRALLLTEQIQVLVPSDNHDPGPH